MSDELRELDAACAQALGWHKGAGGAIIGGYGYQSPGYWYDADGKRCAPCVTDAFANMYAFSPTSDHAAARLLEDEIARRDLIDDYIEQLIAIVDVPDLELDVWPRYEDLWTLARAAPEQKARAFLKAIKGSANG
jgi:hypothetical protein